MNQTVFFVGQAGVVTRDAAWSKHCEHDNLGRKTTETSPDPDGTGAYDLKIVKDQNALVPTALVEYEFTYDEAGNLLTTTEDQAAVAQFGTLGPAASGLGGQTSLFIDALNRVIRYRHIDGATGAVLKRTDYAYRPDGSVGTFTRFAGTGVSPFGSSSTAAYDYADRRIRRVSDAGGQLSSQEGSGSPAISSSKPLSALGLQLFLRPRESGQKSGHT